MPEQSYVVRRTVSGSWIIMKSDQENLAWGGQGWAPIGGGAPCTNFINEASAHEYVRLFGLTRTEPRKPPARRPHQQLQTQTQEDNSMTEFEDAVIETLRRIADALEILVKAVDQEKSVLRMVDVERANVYSTHLGEKLKSKESV